MNATATEPHTWGFVCGRISALEARLLSTEFFQTLVMQTRPEDIMRTLQDTALKESVHPGATWEDFGRLSDAHFHAEVVSLRENCPDPAVTDIFLLRDDFLNLKHALLGDDTISFPAGVFSEDVLRAVASGDRSELPQSLREALEQIEVDRGEIDRVALDVVLDAAYLRMLLEFGSRLGVPAIAEYLHYYVLTKAIVILLRAVRAPKLMEFCRQHLVPLEPHTEVLHDLLDADDVSTWPDLVLGDLAPFLRDAIELQPPEQAPRFEQLAMNWLKEIARQGTAQISGPERVFSYLAALDTETYNLKLVVSGRLSRIETDTIRQRMRECHV